MEVLSGNQKCFSSSRKKSRIFVIKGCQNDLELSGKDVGFSLHNDDKATAKKASLVILGRKK